MSKTICVQPEAKVYGYMGSYGVHQRQEDYILARKMAVIRSCHLGYITPDMAASKIIGLQSEKPLLVEEGERLSEALSRGMSEMSKAFNESARQARDPGVNDE